MHIPTYINIKYKNERYKINIPNTNVSILGIKEMICNYHLSSLNISHIRLYYIYDELRDSLNLSDYDITGGVTLELRSD